MCIFFIGEGIRIVIYQLPSQTSLSTAAAVIGPARPASGLSQRSNAQRIRNSRHNSPNVDTCTLTAKLNAVPENLSFLRRVCVKNEVTDINKFYRGEIRFIRTFSALFSHELHAHFTL